MIINADVLKFAAKYEGELFHGMLSDPPYHLTDPRSAKRGYPARNASGEWDNTGRIEAQGGKGFMGQQWDGGDIAFRPETWAAFLPLLHDGAICMAFAGTRGYHRMATAIEDAGYILHPMLVWAQGSGFPKATRIPNNTDFAGHRYGLQAIKPSLEPICVFQKPYRGKPVDSIIRTGSGTFNIDASRIGTDNDLSRKPTAAKGWKNSSALNGSMSDEWKGGRWTSNLLLDSESADMMDRQSGQSTSRDRPRNNQQPTGKNGIYSHRDAVQSFGHTDKGGASRFFFQSDWDAEEHDPLFYCAKAGRRERDSGLEGFAENAAWNGKGSSNGLSVSAAINSIRNSHPTVKPLKLTKYLASILLPPDLYAPRRLLVPFAGVGSEMIGAMLAGWEEVVGVELSEEYCEIGRARMKFWANNSGLFESVTQENEEEEEEAQGDLFA